MNQVLPMGANTGLTTASGHITISHDISPAIDVSLTAFLLTDQDKVQGDSGIIFYNQPTSETGVATLLPAEQIGNTKVHKLQFDMNKAPVGITKIAVTLTEDNSTGFANVHHLTAEIITGNDRIQLNPSSFQSENGIIVLELYLRNGGTKVKSIWRGFDSGLEGLCINYGVEVEADEPSSSAASQPTADHTPQPAQATPQPVATSESSASPSLSSTQKTETPVSAPVAPNTQPLLSSINLQKVTGKVNLEKGQKSVIIEKTPEITATVSWQTGTDYDIYALVYTRSGEQVDVAMFGAEDVPPLQSFGNGAVEHMGDVGRSHQTTKTEVIKLRLRDDILAVVPVVYSAQSNGTGSFYRYKVSMSIDNHQGTSVTISSKNANNNDKIYTCVPGILQNTADGVIISPLELYSEPNSEYRPMLQMGDSGMVEVVMDEGPVNDYK
ncbi:TerD family protein [Paenibacillus hunanensis]|uniref:TerD family protein n=1 Tax=Paenibacillus hunanensis TaxID=539262 RepID=UPI0020266529|nr:TerD family protein [Paenibacillus hunanensis]MCL9662467.1 TerD family protein [Paenibacillus hunanensis]